LPDRSVSIPTQPKTEAPDYNSDGESKGTFLALDNSMLDNSFSSMHGGLEMLAGPSTQAFTGDPTQDAALGEFRWPPPGRVQSVRFLSVADKQNTQTARSHSYSRQFR
jgi:hypothetical protein